MSGIAKLLENIKKGKYSGDTLHERCIQVVNADGWLISSLPKKCLTEEICLTAVTQYPDALRKILPKMRTHDVCVKALTHSSMNSILKYVPPKLRTLKMCNLAVKQNWFSIPHVPKRLCTSEQYIEWVKMHEDSLRFVPFDYSKKNQLMWLKLIEITPSAIWWTISPTDEMRQLHKVLWEV